MGQPTAPTATTVLLSNSEKESSREGEGVSEERVAPFAVGAVGNPIITGGNYLRQRERH